MPPLPQEYKKFTGTAIDLLLDLSELASNVGCVAIQNWGVSVGDLSGVVENDDLGQEILGSESWIVLGVGCNITASDILD